VFPVTLCLEKARCLVVGGGEVAFHKVEGLLREGAEVTVVAPDAIAALARLAVAGTVAWEKRAYEAGEARAFRLVFAATDRREVNRQVRDDADGAGVWVNVADDPELCTFHLPARLERGPLQVAVGSGGRAPFVVRRLRELLESRVDAAWSEWADAAARFREMVRSNGVGAGRRERLFDRFFAETVDRRRLRVRVPAEAELHAWAAGLGSAPVAGGSGLVSLVGAGPGNSGLLTLRGYRRLVAADAVVYDRLAEPALPCDLSGEVELHAVGKEAGHHPVPQDEINALLISLARQGKRVVRFKGGDPYVFGRGGEEALALHAAGVAFEVIPGISAGVAGPAFAGVPVTQRGVASRVTFFTGHPSPAEGADESGGTACSVSQTTLVGFMGVGNLATVAADLARQGVAEDTPAMLIERATTSRQRCVHATVGTLARVAADERVLPPALLVVGDAVRFATALGWHQRLPLARERLLLTAPAGMLGEALELAGAEVIEVALPFTQAASVAVGALPVTVWLARTTAEAAGFCGELARAAGAAGAVAVCVGGEVATIARECGWPVVREVAGECDAAAVVRAIRED
jgi:uroporphyrin-III C-methyltransferase / precorrin-2 dehydrogenase / sirohydrochlorin ferrochelatase